MNLPLVIHIAAGTVAVFSGIVPIVAEKPLRAGAGGTHRVWGGAFARAMLVVNAGAIVPVSRAQREAVLSGLRQRKQPL